MEGAIFYWIAWIGWTITTFFMVKTRERLFLSGSLLILIYASTITIHVDQFSMNATLLMLALISYAYIGIQRARDLYYSIFVSILLTLVYVGLYFIVIYDPVWVIFGFDLFMALPMSILTLFMIQSWRVRMPVLISAFIHGEIAHTYIFQSINSLYVTGSLSFLSQVSIACVIVGLWSAYEWFIARMKLKVDRPVKHVKEGVQ